jgi:hypothetical protein
VQLLELLVDHPAEDIRFVLGQGGELVIGSQPRCLAG